MSSPLHRPLTNTKQPLERPFPPGGGGNAEAERTEAKSGHYEERIEFSIEYFQVAAHMGTFHNQL